MKRLFITGIGTGIGKTVVAAFLTELLAAEYWKPVQAGNLDFTDSDRVRSLVSNPKAVIHPETFRLKLAASPHLAAERESVQIELPSIRAPSHNGTLIIEGAGGILVPLNRSNLAIDLIPHLSAKVVIVSRNYLGSINHTLLTIDALRARNIPIVGLVFSGDSNPESEEIIAHFAKVPKIFSLPNIEPLTKEEVFKLVQGHRSSILPKFQAISR